MTAPSLGAPRPRLVTAESLRSAGTIALAGAAFLVVQGIVFPAPLGVILQGVIAGGLTALIALGISLVYRANRIINFSQGDLGAVPAVSAVLLITTVGVPFLVALPIGIAVALLLGMVIEFVVIRRFAEAPRLILTVATLGLAQALAGFGLVLPLLLNNAWPTIFDSTNVASGFTPPFDWRVDVGTVVFNANDIIAAASVVIAVVALTVFFRYTRIGIAVRASAESGDRAMLLGIPVKRIQTIVWVIASLLAFTSLFMRAGVFGLPLGSVLGPTVLIRALAACVIGRMENLTVIFWAAIGLGVLERAVIWDTNRVAYVAPILFAVVLGVLLVQRRGALARTDAQSHWQAVADVRAVPRELAGVPEVRWGLRGVNAALVAIVLALPLVLPVSRVNLAATIAIYAMVAVSLVVLTGWAGQVSLGQIAFFGFGAAVGGSITTRLGWDLSLAILGAGLVGAGLAVVIGLPALRLRGLFLAVTTLAFAQATAVYFLNAGDFSWWLPSGRIPRNDLFGVIALASETQYYYFAVACLFAVMAMARQLRRSRVGRVIIGVRENERGAQAYGVNLVRAKLTAFAFSGFVAAVAGAVFVHHQRALGTQPYEATESLAVFTMVVIGGLGSLPGAIVGAVYVKGSQAFLPTELTFFVSGVGLLFVLVALPGGLASLVYRARDAYLRWVAQRRKIMVPSLFADAADLDSITSGRDKGMAFVRQLADVMDASRDMARASRAQRPGADPAGTGGADRELPRSDDDPDPPRPTDDGHTDVDTDVDDVTPSAPRGGTRR
ncbi:MAG: ABC transporter permease [Acidimicrobiales bacterium]